MLPLSLKGYLETLGALPRPPFRDSLEHPGPQFRGVIWCGALLILAGSLQSISLPTEIPSNDFISAELKRPRKLSRIRPEILDFDPELALKRSQTKPKIPGTATTNRHTALPNDCIYICVQALAPAH